MSQDLQLIYITFEAILAALVWLLYRRSGQARRERIELEAAQGLMKKRFEAATAGLHFRLQQVERQLKQAPAAARREAPAGLIAARAPLSRGEADLLMKVRQYQATP